MKLIYLNISLLLLIGILSCKKEKPQSEVDEKIIKDYLTLNSINATRTPSGLYYIITDTTQGQLATFGKKLDVHYEGKILNGGIFDANFQSSNPFTFILGSGAVIQGWDEGFMHVRQGEKAEFFIPSELGYGRNGSGTSIPPNSILHFIVYLDNIQ